MVPQNQVRTVSIQDIEFQQPLPDAYKLIRKKHIGSSMIGVIISGVFAVGGIWSIAHTEDAAVIVISALLIALFCFLVLRMLQPVECEVRFGTVTDDYSRTTGSGDNETTDYYVTIRFDDTGEIIHNLHIIPHLSIKQMTNRQVMLSRQKKRFHLYDASNLEHPVWNPSSAAQTAYPNDDADGRPLPQAVPEPAVFSPAANEVTIQDIRFHDLPPELYEHIVKSKNTLTWIAAAVVICMLVPFIGFVIMSIGREMLEYWFITLPVLAVIAILFIIVGRNEKKNRTQPVLECVQVQIIDCKTNYAPIRITFTVPETGQTVVDQRIDLSYCGLQLSGMTVMLVRNEQNIYSIYPPDFRHR
ncbi:MAG: hypothetical protein IJM46_03375 [Oscillospiraceae bacterium]|nr:hypothetical protein [Oscillospiraceae bacterium]